jgi:predicted ATPase
MHICPCREVHTPRRIVLTGGPGAGKTAVLELCRQYLCEHVSILPESASLLFTGGFPRGGGPEQRAATQRAIYYVQRELERIGALEDSALVLCDRGTVDGAAYWPGPGSLFDDVDSSLAAELSHYDAVVHLRVPDVSAYNHQNPVRIESALEAASIDARIAEIWSGHPRRLDVPSSPDFFEKAQRALSLIVGMVPACCRVSLSSFPPPPVTG